MSEPKWHHYVPQMFLRAWLDPKLVAKGQHRLWVYESGKRIRQTGPKSVAAEEGFYETTGFGSDVNTIEKLLGELESIAACHLQKLRSGDVNFSAEHKSEFASFIGLSAMRTKLARERQNSIAVQLLRQGFAKELRDKGADKLMADYQQKTGRQLGVDRDKLIQIVQAVTDGSVELVQKSKDWNIKQSLERGIELGSVLEKMRWVLLKAPDGRRFITSDNPVHMNEPTKGKGPKGFLFSTGMQLFFPIAPNRLLYGDFMGTKHEAGTLRETDETVDKVNRRMLEQAAEQVYASFRSEDVQKELEEVFKNRAPLIPEIPLDTSDK